MKYKIAYSMSCTGWVEIEERPDNAGFDIVDGYVTPMQAQGVATEATSTQNEALIAGVIQVLEGSLARFKAKIGETMQPSMAVTQVKGDA